MKCTVKELPPLDLNLSPAELRGEWDRIAKENLESIEQLIASKRLVSLCQDPIPTNGLEEGMPIRWSDKHHPVPALPHGDNNSPEIGGSSAGLE